MADIKVIGRLDIKGMDIIRRVYDPDGIAPTLNTCGGGYRQVKVIDLKKFRVRKLTPTEYGRLQAFPMENWEQVVSDSQAYKQFGNAVTVSVVTAIAGKLKEALEAEAPETTQDSLIEAQETPRQNEIKPLSEYTSTELLEELMRRQIIKV